MTALYNDNEPFSADWLQDLIAHDLIAPGRVDRRSITELAAGDLAGDGQRHFFAGIGGWSYALRLAGVPDNAPIWTGSCPCQPLSDAGQGRGFRDPRHLWPAWFSLIEECRPAVILGSDLPVSRSLCIMTGVFGVFAFLARPRASAPVAMAVAREVVPSPPLTLSRRGPPLSVHV